MNEDFLEKCERVRELLYNSSAQEVNDLIDAGPYEEEPMAVLALVGCVFCTVDAEKIAHYFAISHGAAEALQKRIHDFMLEDA